MNNYLDDNFNYLADFLEKELPHAEFKIPEATYLAWVDLSYYIKEKILMNRWRNSLLKRWCHH